MEDTDKFTSKGVLNGGTNHAIMLKIWQNHTSRLDI